MQISEKKTFARQMYTADSEAGKMKLQAVKENLYEASTKVVLYSVEMYTKKNLADWVQSDLMLKLDKANKDINRKVLELEDGNIRSFDITNGCSVINDFVRKDALAVARNEVQGRLTKLKSKLAEIDEKLEIIDVRKNSLDEDESEDDFEEFSEEVNDFFDEDEDGDYITTEDFDDEDQEDDIDDEDEDEDEGNAHPISEIDLFEKKISIVKDLDELLGIEDELKEQRSDVENQTKKLNDLTSNGKNILADLSSREREALEELRTIRNTEFAHKNEDEDIISQIGSWEPEAGPLYTWATTILKYIDVVSERYSIYALFDEYYAIKEGKDKFDGCKVYVQRQIKELYVNRSSVVFEFAGELYDKEDDEYNFKKLIESMAVSWNTGIRYLTVVTNDDLPELNIFFKECLSGTNKYVDSYLLNRNALRDACKRKESKDADYIYFRLLYSLNSDIEKIYWRGKEYSQNEFARQVIYKFIKVKNMFQFDGRLKDYEKYIDGIDIAKWSENHLLSEVYFGALDDAEGSALAREMEDAIVDFCKHGENKGRMVLYKRAIKASVQLYFYMGKEYVFSYTRSNGQTIHWKTLDHAKKYLENAKQFKSYSELCGFVDELYKSDYYKIWKKQLKKNSKIESEV